MELNEHPSTPKQMKLYANYRMTEYICGKHYLLIFNNKFLNFCILDSHPGCDIVASTKQKMTQFITGIQRQMQSALRP